MKKFKVGDLVKYTDYYDEDETKYGIIINYDKSFHCVDGCDKVEDSYMYSIRWNNGEIEKIASYHIHYTHSENYRMVKPLIKDK